LLVTIKPHSTLQQYFIGDTIAINIDSYSDLLDYLIVMQPRFMFYTKELMAEGIQESFVFLDEQLTEITRDDLFVKRFKQDTTIHIVPAIVGGGGKRGGIFAILASAALFFFAGPLGAFLDPIVAVAGLTGKSVITQLAVGLAISGLSALLMKSPVSPKDSEKNRVENNMFASLRNTIDSGTFVPVNYGQVRVAGQLITGYIKTINHPKGFNVKVSDIIGFNNALVDPILAAQSGFLTLPTSLDTITTSGLIMYIDASNKGSYPGSGNTVVDLISGQQGDIIGNVSLQDFAFKLDNAFIDMNKTYISAAEINNTKKTYTIDTWVNLSNNISNANVITNSALGIAVDKDVVNYTQDLAAGQVIISTVFPKFKSINTTPIIDNNGTMNKWQHVALAVANNTAKLYINGVFNTAATVNTDITGESNLIIASSELADASLALARLYSRALNDDEIVKNFKSEKSRFGL
jgi:predicted phage tail protein